MYARYRPAAAPVQDDGEPDEGASPEEIFAARALANARKEAESLSEGGAAGPDNGPSEPEETAEVPKDPEPPEPAGKPEKPAKPDKPGKKQSDDEYTPLFGG